MQEMGGLVLIVINFIVGVLMFETSGLVLVLLLIVAAILFLLSLVSSLKNDELSKFKSLKLMMFAMLILSFTSFFLINSGTEYSSANSAQGLSASFVVFILVTGLFYAVYKSKKTKMDR